MSRAVEGWKIYLYMWDFFRIFVFQEKYIYESNKQERYEVRLY